MLAPQLFQGEEVMSYSVLTTEASKTFSVLHHRLPVILETDEEVEVRHFIKTNS